jgi:pimeloyl-ACP methyl ester carboxylesterase
MWARAAREIAAAYAREGSPLAALSALTPPCPTLHLYAQPDDPGYLIAQQQFSAAHPWFSVHKVTGRSHFPTIEAPEEVSAQIDAFVPRTTS